MTTKLEFFKKIFSLELSIGNRYTPQIAVMCSNENLLLLCNKLISSEDFLDNHKNISKEIIYDFLIEKRYYSIVNRIIGENNDEKINTSFRDYLKSSIKSNDKIPEQNINYNTKLKHKISDLIQSKNLMYDSIEKLSELHKLCENDINSNEFLIKSVNLIKEIPKDDWDNQSINKIILKVSDEIVNDILDVEIKLLKQESKMLEKQILKRKETEGNESLIVDKQDEIKRKNSKQIKSKILNLINKENNFIIYANYIGPNKEFEFDDILIKKNNKGDYMSVSKNFDEYDLFIFFYEYFTPNFYLGTDDGYGILEFEDNKLTFELEEDVDNERYNFETSEFEFLNEDYEGFTKVWEITDEGIFEIEE